MYSCLSVIVLHVISDLQMYQIFYYIPTSPCIQTSQVPDVGPSYGVPSNWLSILWKSGFKHIPISIWGTSLHSQENGSISHHLVWVVSAFLGLVPVKFVPQLEHTCEEFFGEPELFNVCSAKCFDVLCWKWSCLFLPLIFPWFFKIFILHLFCNYIIHFIAFFIVFHFHEMIIN